MRIAYKIFRAEEWHAMLNRQVFSGSQADLADGYIHMSTAEQLPGTLAKHYAGEAGLTLAEVELGALDIDHLQWEPARAGLFPHYYAPLPFAALGRDWPLAVENGVHVLPALGDG